MRGIAKIEKIILKFGSYPEKYRARALTFRYFWFSCKNSERALVSGSEKAFGPA